MARWLTETLTAAWVGCGRECKGRFPVPPRRFEKGPAGADCSGQGQINSANASKLSALSHPSQAICAGRLL